MQTKSAVRLMFSDRLCLASIMSRFSLRVHLIHTIIKKWDTYIHMHASVCVHAHTHTHTHTHVHTHNVKASVHLQNTHISPELQRLKEQLFS